MSDNSDQIRNPLFQGDPMNPHMNACVGENGGPYDFADYAIGFFKGGEAIVEQAKLGHLPVDVLIYPVAYSYRHGIELFLKHLLNQLNVYNGLDAGVAKGHKLDLLWKRCHAQIKKAGDLNFPKETVRRAGSIITTFCDFDKTGEVFRYPENLKGNKTISGFNVINLQILAGYMSELYEIMYDFIHVLEEYIQIQHQVRWEW